MPQIKSQMKRVKTNNKAHKLIVSKKSALKSSIKAVLAAVDAQDKEAAENPPAKINVQHVVVFVAAIAVYIYLIPILGYFIATPLYMVVMYAYLKAIGLLKSIIISVCFSAFIYALFVWFLKLPIPVGFLEHFMGY